MTKWKKDCFIIELKLLIDIWQKDSLLKRFEIARTLYNTTLSYAVKQYTFMQESKHYRKQLRCWPLLSGKRFKMFYLKGAKHTLNVTECFILWKGNLIKQEFDLKSNLSCGGLRIKTSGEGFLGCSIKSYIVICFCSSISYIPLSTIPTNFLNYRVCCY